MARHPNGNGTSNTDRILIALTALALNCPSTFTIAWSKEEHKEEMPILYAGIATSAATVGGAILGEKHYGNEIMWTGLLGTLGLFAYVAFFYKPRGSTAKSKQGYPLIISTAPSGLTHLVV
jgi:hypothetical protein